MIAILCITALLGSAYLVLAASPRIPLDGFSTGDLPFGGFTTNNGVTIPYGTLDVTVNHGGATLIPIVQLDQIRFSVSGQATFIYTSDDETLEYTGVASFSGNGVFSSTYFENSRISFRATVTATGPDNVPFTFVLLAKVSFDQNGDMTLSFTSPNTDFSLT